MLTISVGASQEADDPVIVIYLQPSRPFLSNSDPWGLLFPHGSQSLGGD